MNMTYLGRGAAAIVLPTFLFACGGSGGGGGQAPQDPPPQFTVVDNDTSQANGINGIVHADDGSVYAIGVSDQADQRTVILGYNADGSVNTDFGTDGVLSLNVRAASQDAETASSGDEQGFGIVEMADGDLVIVVNAADANGDATVDPPVAEGRSVYLFRLDVENSFAVETEFGDDGAVAGLLAGAQEVVFATANADNGNYLSTTGFLPRDAATDLVLDTSGDSERLVILGAGSAPVEADAPDQDRYVARVTAANGMADMSFNSGEAHHFTTTRGENSGDNVRRGFVEDDGSIMSAGYTNFGGSLGNHIILIKLNEDGSQESGFGNFIFPADGPAGIAEPGIAVFNPFVDSAGFAEAYAAVRQPISGNYITTGYGAANSGPDSIPDDSPLSGYAPTEEQDVVTFRLSGGTEIDAGYGRPGAAGTQAIQSEDDSVFAGDVEADLLRPEERGRDMVVLPDDRSIHVGYFGGVPALYVFTADGQLDTSVDDDGLILLPHDGTPQITQQFFTAELSADNTRLAVGTRGIDDAGARVVIVDLEPEE
ncbi:MAG: hypothetical protein RJQ08_00825 [Salinisphaeraceae bacterium]